MKGRFAYPPKQEDDHTMIITNIHSLEKRIKVFKPEDGAEGLRAIIHAFEVYEKSLLPHLIEEEKVGLLLMRAYFTQDEIRPVIAKILSRGTLYIRFND